MIHVIAAISIKPGTRDEFLKIFKRNIPNVLAEDGCLGYEPTVDFDSGFDIQEKDSNVVTIIEKWESIEHLKAHLAAPHMLEYKQQVKDIALGVSLRILQPA